MQYPPFLHFDSEAKYRAEFEKIYCQGTITTFDGIKVHFRKKDFDHCCFETPKGAKRKGDKRKGNFCQNRAKRLHWIKEALKDRHSARRVGWDSDNKCYNPKRRVAIVVRNYVIVVELTKMRDQIQHANFITAYVGDDHVIQIIKNGPKWT